MAIRRHYQPVDPDYQSRVRGSFARQGAMGLLGAELTRIEPGLVEIELPWRPELTQQNGFFHAGITATIADSAGGYAGYTLFPPASEVLTVEFKLNLLAPADGERLIASGHVLRHGRTLTICELAVAVEKDGKRLDCAHGTQTLIAKIFAGRN